MSIGEAAAIATVLLWNGYVHFRQVFCWLGFVDIGCVDYGFYRRLVVGFGGQAAVHRQQECLAVFQLGPAVQVWRCLAAIF